MGHGKRGCRPKRSGERQPKQHYEDIEETNDHFELYYADLFGQKTMEEIVRALRRPLPNAFRISASGSQGAEMKRLLEEKYFPALKACPSGVDQPTSIDWYPEPIAWKHSVDRMALRKNKVSSEALKEFHAFLVRETAVGNVSRQEEVSMVPAMLLDVQPGHSVLDMCAAPGSKTAQIVELMMCAGPTSDGMVIANDSNEKRAHMLVHQMNRLQAPHVLITNYEGQHFPNIHIPSDAPNATRGLRFDRVLADVPCTGDGTMRKNKSVWKDWKFSNGRMLQNLQLRIVDRGIALTKVGGIIVYSTCSMNPVEDEAVVAEMLRKYRGKLELVDTSGRLPGLKRVPGLTSWRLHVPHTDELIERPEDWPQPPDRISQNSRPSKATSTTFNQSRNCQKEIEDPTTQTDSLNGEDLVPPESTVRTDGQPENQDSVSTLPSSRNEAKQRRPRGGVKKRVVKAFLPPPASCYSPTEEEIQWMHLERCTRLLPHLQDTGGFFVAVLQKTAETHNLVVSANRSPQSESTDEKLITGDESLPRDDGDSAADGPGERGTRDIDEVSPSGINGMQSSIEEPFLFANPEDPFLRKVFEFYGVRSNIGEGHTHSLDMATLFTRSDRSPFTVLYLVTPAVASVFRATRPGRIRIVNAGVKLFVRVQEKHDPTRNNHRVTMHGLPFLLPHVSDERKISVGASDMWEMLNQEYPRFEDLSEALQKELEGQPVSALLGKYVAAPPRGCDNSAAQDNNDAVVVWFPLWKAQTSVNMLVKREEKCSIASMCRIPWKGDTNTKEP